MQQASSPRKSQQSDAEAYESAMAEAAPVVHIADHKQVEKESQDDCEPSRRRVWDQGKMSAPGAQSGHTDGQDDRFTAWWLPA
jgi:hypothetical protein